ncbi:MAG TPA: alpha/beta hydrolase [Flavisolibacter sp.]|nr:alpha/beta hydrolase [Flavisolibacter sp.]
MNILIAILQILVAVAGCIAVLVSIPLFFAFRWPAAAMWGLKLFVSAVSPVFALVGVFTAMVGILTGSVFISFLGLAVVGIYVFHIISVTRPPAAATGFDRAFGSGWENSISPQQKTYFFPRRMAFRLPSVPRPRLQQNVPFAIIPGTNRELLCDLWQPPEAVPPTGIAFIYLHGSAFYFLDKDFGTRPFFRHLAAQGYVIMDVAYRLPPETDIMGMVHDARRAIAWMKEQAGNLNIHADRTVIAGGSAGAHLALLTAYTSDDPTFTPPDVTGKDTRVCAVISLYGTNDLEALYYHTNQHLTSRSAPGKHRKAVPTKMPGWMVKAIGKDFHRLGLDKDFATIGALAVLLGGHPDECPEQYARFSPVTHVHPNCPPTLLIHGEHDIMAPVASTRRLYTRLAAENVPTVLHVLPQTDHGFDLALPNLSPSAHNAVYDVERFLALIAAGKGSVAVRRSPAEGLLHPTQPLTRS